MLAVCLAAVPKCNLAQEALLSTSLWQVWGAPHRGQSLAVVRSSRHHSKSQASHRGQKLARGILGRMWPWTKSSQSKQLWGPLAGVGRPTSQAA